MEEAVRACLLSAAATQREMASVAASIILSRSSWEAFSNEMIEQRMLPVKLKNADSKTRLDGIFGQLLDASETWRSVSVWQDFMLVNDIRNVIVHQKNVARSPADLSMRILQALESKSVIGPPTATDVAWEARVLTTQVARWCCQNIGAAIIALESIPARQFRATEHIQARVNRTLSLFKDF